MRRATLRAIPVTLAQLDRLLDSVGAQPLSTAYPVWELARPRLPFSKRARRFRETQIRVLDAIRTLPWSPFLRTPDNPRQHGLCGPWQLAARDTWVVPAEQVSSVLLDRFLLLGSWTLYLAVDPVSATSLPRCFESTPHELCVFVESRGVPVLVEASRDNHRWRLVIEPAAVPEVVAA